MCLYCALSALCGGVLYCTVLCCGVLYSMPKAPCSGPVFGAVQEDYVGGLNRVGLMGSKGALRRKGDRLLMLRGHRERVTMKKHDPFSPSNPPDPGMNPPAGGDKEPAALYLLAGREGFRIAAPEAASPFFAESYVLRGAGTARTA